MRVTSLFLILSLCILFASVSGTKRFRKTEAIQCLPTTNLKTATMKLDGTYPIDSRDNTLFCNNWGDCPAICLGDTWRKCKDEPAPTTVNGKTYSGYCVCSLAQTYLWFEQYIKIMGSTVYGYNC